MIDASSDKARGVKRMKIGVEDMGWVEVDEKRNTTAVQRGKRKDEK